MNHEEQCNRIDEHVDVRVHDLEDRFDRHLEIYANNGKELKELKSEIHHSVENLIQQISGVGSDVKKIQIDFATYVEKVKGLEEDKNSRNNRYEWFIRTVFGVLIVALLVLLGIEIK